MMIESHFSGCSGP